MWVQAWCEGVEYGSLPVGLVSYWQTGVSTARTQSSLRSVVMIYL